MIHQRLNILKIGWLCFLAMSSVADQVENTKFRRWWVKPHLYPEVRIRYGAYASVFLVYKLKDHEEFHNFVGMNVFDFENLFTRIKDKLRSESHRPGLEPELKLAVVLNYLVNGGHLPSLATYFKIGRSTMYELVRDVTRIIFDVLSSEFLKFPEGREWLTISQEFQDLYDFPNCLGPIDAKHFEIKRPDRSGAKYFNRNHYYSIVMMTFCDAYQRFKWASAGAPGYAHDSTILENSELGQALRNRTINFPPSSSLPNTHQKFPFTFIADPAFALSERVLTLYKKSESFSIEENIFNIRVSNPRKVVECGFGTLVKRFQVLDKRLDLSVKVSKTVIMCCVVLHNFIITSQINKNLEDDEKDGDCEGEMDVTVQSGEGEGSIAELRSFRGESSQINDSPDEVLDDCEGLSAKEIRERWKIYFVTEGNRQWQWRRLMRT